MARGGRSVEAARTKADRRAEIESLHLSPLGKSEPVRNELSTSTPPLSISSNVDVPSPSSRVLRNFIATADAFKGS